ncbi:hypothetical protein AUJ17_00150 [Candidatus Micrarchaeota archaeon CG1_02_47_40]|nr:MAG: hypothetical protein AUJ17_00150 [Candidatus Micrarchaeota archaeon CG1_02_47_40]
MIIILSVGGSMVNPGKPDQAYISSLSQIFKNSPHSFGIVVGGGKLAREYAEGERKKGKGEFWADLAAIRATKENAGLFLSHLRGICCLNICDDFIQAHDALQKHRIVLMGGTIPGITTDADAALLAECIGAKRLVNVSNVDGIYDKNPAAHKDAKKFGTLSFEKLVSLAQVQDTRHAGGHFIFDMLACKLIARSKIESHFVSGKNLEDVKNAIEGTRHNGTVVR